MLFFGELDDIYCLYKFYCYCLGEVGVELVFEEGDGCFFLYCYCFSLECQLIFLFNSKIISEVWVFDVDQLQGMFCCLVLCEEGYEYYFDYGCFDGWGLWLICSNQVGINFVFYQVEELWLICEYW